MSDLESAARQRRLRALKTAGALLALGVVAVATVWVTELIAPAPKPGGSTPVLDPSARRLALAEENALIERAQAALSRGDAAQAKAALHEHATRFPKGQLVTQRKLLEAYAERVESDTR
jgi:hypothetical protein